jgi:WXXGXW repeat (2 copies)
MEEAMRFANRMRLLLAATVMLVAVLALGEATKAQVAFQFRVNFGPPELPVYEQPICPGDGYIWTPGYWAWDDADGDYYWVPGTWVLAPEPGYLWTPGYWGWYDSAYVFYPGYWGPVVGFYGGINYGFGYFGRGYEGGRWEGRHFFYNRAVNRVDEREIHNVYNTRVVERNDTHVSFNGGRGGIEARPSAQEEAAARERHMGPVAAQQQHINAARGDRSLRASENHGRPPVAATSRAGSFSGGGVEAARSGGNYNRPPNRGGNAGGTANGTARTDRPPAARTESGANGANRTTYVHPNEVPKHERPQPSTSSGSPRADQKYQQQQDKMYQKQEQEHQKLQQKQDQEHQRASQKQANEPQKQQMEQRHQQQTQQMEQRHTQQQQQMQRQAPQPRQQPPHGGGEPHH